MGKAAREHGTYHVELTLADLWTLLFVGLSAALGSTPSTMKYLEPVFSHSYLETWWARTYVSLG